MTSGNAEAVGSALKARLVTHEWELSALPTRVQRALDGIDRIVLYHLPMNIRFRGVESREGLLLHGPGGWGEAAPFWDYDPVESSLWLASALDWARSNDNPAPTQSIPVNVTIPVTSAHEAQRRVEQSGGCATAKVKVAGDGTSIAADCQRIEAVADALARTVGVSNATIRIDVNGQWDVDTATKLLIEYDRAATYIGGLQYVEQPCVSVDALVELRRRQKVPIAADESIRRAADPMEVFRRGGADYAVMKVAPLGGVRRVERLAADCGVPVVISSALETSIGLAQGLAAASLRGLGADLACGLATTQLLTADIVETPLVVENGRMAFHAYGLPAVLFGAGHADESWVAQWQERLEAMCDVLLEGE